MSTTLQTYDNTAPECKYSGNWFLFGTWQDSDGDLGTLSSTNDQGASVMFTFPVPAVAFRYFGMKRSRGGKYGICVDCDPNNLAFEPIDAFDPTDNGENPPSILFQQTFSSPSVHVIIIHNEPDDRGTPTGNSQLTLDRFELDVPVTPVSTDVVVITTTAVVQPPTGGGNDNSTSQRGTTVATTPPATASSDQTSPSAVASPTSASSSSPISGPNTGANQTSPSTTDSAITPSSSHKPPVGAIVGATLGGLALLALVIFLWRWMRRRSARSPATASDSFSGALANANTDSSSASNNPRRPRGRARREQDAGPVPQHLLDDDDDNDGETLPPDYRQVFNDRMSGRASQRSRPAPSSPPPPPPPPPPLPTSTVEGSRPPQGLMISGTIAWTATL